MTIENRSQIKRFLLEVVVIVGSILLAFAIDAWWDDRSDKNRLQGAIQNIADEVSDARKEIERAVKRNTFRIDGMKRFLNLQPDEIQLLSDDELKSFRLVFVTPSPFDSSDFALQGFLAGGNLEIVADDELRKALIVWAQFPNEIERDYDEAVQLAMALFEHMTQHGVFVAISNEIEYMDVPDAIQFRDVLLSLRRDAKATEAMAQYLFYFEDFNRQYARGTEYADRVLSATQSSRN